ncbi:hypothetical protein ACN28S_19065 [Cystobacter fuscus]
MTLGCQPDISEAPATMASGTEALSTGVGTWTPTATKALPYPSNSAVRLRATGEVLESYQGFVQRYNPYTDTGGSRLPPARRGSAASTRWCS